MTNLVDEFVDRTTPQAYHFRGVKPSQKKILERIKRELRQSGAMSINLRLPETKYLAQLIHDDEHIMGSVYGKYKDGRGVLIATDQRVLFVDKKPGFTHVDEMSFAIIGGVTLTKSAMVSFVTLHSRLGDYKLRTFNLKNAANFVDYIETQCLQDQRGTDTQEQLT